MSGRDGGVFVFVWEECSEVNFGLLLLNYDEG